MNRFQFLFNFFFLKLTFRWRYLFFKLLYNSDYSFFLKTLKNTKRWKFKTVYKKIESLFIKKFSSDIFNNKPNLNLSPCHTRLTNQNRGDFPYSTGKIASNFFLFTRSFSLYGVAAALPCSFQMPGAVRRVEITEWNILCHF